MKQSEQFNLGLDKSRIKDIRDGQRQSTTVDALLDRFFNANETQRWDLQILADEVGMGKTFVGLGVAYSILESMRNRQRDGDLRRCYQKVLIITPRNSALFSKWRREVGEFVKRCVQPEFREEASQWFGAVPVERVDDLVNELRKRGPGPRVIVANMGIFSGGKLKHYDVKRRQLLGVLFRYWGTRFRIEQRKKLLKGAPDNWPFDPSLVEVFDNHEQGLLLFSDDELANAICKFDRQDEQIDRLLKTCKEIAAPYVRQRDELFSKITNQLNHLYRDLMKFLIGKSLPLVIVDEAHNWKNGPTNGSNGYQDFTELIACRTRRALLLTATPFQLRPAEMLEILKVGDHLAPCPTQAESEPRRNRLKEHREKIVQPILAQSARHSRRFAKAWSKLPPGITTKHLQAVWESAPLVRALSQLDALAKQHGIAATSEVEQLIDAALYDIDPDIRQLMREGLRLFVFNSDLSYELGTVVVRHHRRTGHRLFQVGVEYQDNGHCAMERTDRHVLHSSPGIDVTGEGELPHYLLMRCISEMKQGHGRSSLGSALTGCYSTLINSAEGKSVQKLLSRSGIGKVYLNLLMGMVKPNHDPKHPKVREVVDAAIRNWRAGEKTLVFCFRTNTAKRLHDIIDKRIRQELNRRRNRCMGGPESLAALRKRLTGRDDLVTLGMDRVLWSILWNEELRSLSQRPMTPDDLALMDDELPQLAELGLRHGVDRLVDGTDRVFLHRSTEHIVAQRLLREICPFGQLKEILNRMADEDWIRYPYGLKAAKQDEDSGSDTAHFDERGVHTVYESVGNPNLAAITATASELSDRRHRVRKQGRVAVLDIYQRGANLWLGTDPGVAWEQREDESLHNSATRTIRALHQHTFDLTISAGQLDWESRLTTFQAIRRAVLRESVLLRLLPTEKEREDSEWGELLVEKFYVPLPQQRESMADRISVFLEDLLAASGELTDPNSARYAMYDVTKLRDQQFVALVSGIFGSKDRKTRERVFSGFNTPLLPEVLICTSVGQEGIDLHRHCRHVVHFDLAWNPAVMEQRTGRVDRIGSKTFRERSLSHGPPDMFLEIGVPYLAGTYDERMFEELRLRAQTFEVLTGGDLTVDEADGHDDRKNADGNESQLGFVALPNSMVETMRVHLHVWEDRATPDPPINQNPL